jgi:hypothetical protein
MTGSSAGRAAAAALAPGSEVSGPGSPEPCVGSSEEGADGELGLNHRVTSLSELGLPDDWALSTSLSPASHVREGSSGTSESVGGPVAASMESAGLESG